MTGNIRKEVVPEIAALSQEMARTFDISQTLAENILLPPDGGERDMARVFNAVKAVALMRSLGEIAFQLDNISQEVNCIEGIHDER